MEQNNHSIQQSDQIHPPLTSKKESSSNPNVSSLTSTDLLCRNEVKKARQFISPSYRQHQERNEKPYYSADNIHDADMESNEASIIKTLEKFNMTPAGRKDGPKSQDPLIQKLATSIAELIDDSISPADFNHVREDIILQKITDIHASRGDLIEKEDVISNRYDRITGEEALDIEKLLSIAHKSRDDELQNVKNFEKPNITSKKGFFDRFKKMFVNSASNQEISDTAIIDHIHAGTDWSPLVPDPKTFIPKPYSLGTIQRLRKLKVIYNQMKDPEKGLKYNTTSKTSGLKYMKNWFTGILTILNKR